MCVNEAKLMCLRPVARELHQLNIIFQVAIHLHVM